MGRELTRTAALLALLALWSGAGAAGQWVNPREAIQDASLARLQQGRRGAHPPGEGRDRQVRGHRPGGDDLPGR